MSERQTGGRRGCLIALGVIGAATLICGGVLTWAGYAVWTNPNVQRGVAITGAAMEIAQNGMIAPGTEALRAEGCTQPLALTTEAMERFYVSAELETPPPELPFVICIMAQTATPVPSCGAVAQTYLGALEVPPDVVAARVVVQGERDPRCQGVYAGDGALVDDIDPTMVRTFGQIGATPTSLGH